MKIRNVFAVFLIVLAIIFPETNKHFWVTVSLIVIVGIFFSDKRALFALCINAGIYSTASLLWKTEFPKPIMFWPFVAMVVTFLIIYFTYTFTQKNLYKK